MVNQITNDLFLGGGLLSWKSSASCGLNRTGGWILSQAQELEKKERKRKKKKRERERPFRLCDVLLFGPGEKCLLGCPLMPSLHQHVCTVNESHVTCGWFLRNYRLPVASVTHTHTQKPHKYTGNILHPSARKNSTVCFLLYEHWEPLTAWKTRLMFCGLWMCVDLADMLSLWCCNPVTNSVLYLLVGIWFLASVALNYNHFSL